MLNGQAKELFEKCAVKKSKFNGADQAYEGIRNEYYKVLESADEKVMICLIPSVEHEWSSLFKLDVVQCSVSVIPLQHRSCSVCMSFVRIGHHNG